MDFWARLIGGVGASPASKKASEKHNPQQRLARFKRTFNQLIHTWRNGTAPSTDPTTLETVRAQLQRLTAILHDESHSPPPHPCLSFATASELHAIVGHIGTRASHHAGIIREVINAFSTLIDCEDEFLQDEGFAASLVSFVRTVNSSGSSALAVVGDEAEGDMIELMFGVAAKIRLQPEILPVWFTAREDVMNDRGREVPRDSSQGETGDEDGTGSNFAGITKREDFPLFYLLIDYVHHEGRVGDFARTGLLYIIESASISEQLEQWIIESDLATLMASGLGALYSQLSRKLAIAYPVDELPTILALSDYSAPPQSSDIEVSTSPEFQSHLETFLSYLAFWQDVLDHCKSVEVRQTLLDHFRVLFLQQLLYPSLLESSDIDGGSSIAVLTYLRRILESLNHPDLIHLILEYLLAFPEDGNAKMLNAPKSPRAARRRRTLDMMTETGHGTDRPTPTLFNLVDLIISSLRSRSQQTKGATLKLVSVILRRHHRYALSTLIHTMPTSRSAKSRTVGALNAEMGFLFSLASEIDPTTAIQDGAYENHLKDNMELLESHSCTESLLGSSAANVSRPKPRRVSSKLSTTINTGPREVYAHMLRPEDPLLTTTVEILEDFFTNAVETNLNLTAAVIDLAACGFMNLQGWLAVAPEKYRYENKSPSCVHASSASSFDSDSESDPGPDLDPSTELENSRLRALSLARREPTWLESDTPPILAALSSLISQLTRARAQIPDFENLLAERRQAFQVSDDLKEALASTSLSLHPKPPMKALPEQQQQQHQQQRTSTPDLGGSGVGPAPVPSSPRGRAQQPYHLPPPREDDGTSPTRLPRPQLQNGRLASPSPHAPPSPRRTIGGLSQSPVRPGHGLGVGGSADTPQLQARTATPPPTFATQAMDILNRKIVLNKTSERLETMDRARHGQGSTVEDGALKPREHDEDRNDGGSRGIAMRTRRRGEVADGPTASHDASETQDRYAHGDQERSITISHLLTNTVILQEFILELAALMQLRASLFGDVGFLA